MDINLIREDTEKIQIRFKRFGKEVVPNGFEEGDIFTLTVRGRKGEVVFDKHINYPEDIFYLTSGDTSKLISSPYKYDIQYRKPNKSYKEGIDEEHERYEITKTLVIGMVNVRQDVSRWLD